jgi:hypothetical protein
MLTLTRAAARYAVLSSPRNISLSPAAARAHAIPTASATAATAPPWSVLYWFCTQRAGPEVIRRGRETVMDRESYLRSRALTATPGEMVRVQETRDEETVAEETMARTSAEQASARSADAGRGTSTPRPWKKCSVRSRDSAGDSRCGSTGGGGGIFSQACLASAPASSGSVADCGPSPGQIWRNDG